MLGVLGLWLTPGPAEAAVPPPKQTALWVWSWENPKELADFVAEEGFDRVYLYCQGGFDPEVRRTIFRLTRGGVLVEALGGERNWATSGREGMLEFVQSARRYQRTAGPGQRLAGIHLDVEPHALDAWDRHPGRTRRSFLNSLRQAGSVAGSMRVSVDIPFWFDGIEVRQRGHRQALSGAILRVVDAATIMAYRDDPAETIALSRRELRQASRLGKDLTVGVETGRTSPEYVTFFEEGRAALDRALARVRAAFGESPAFAGTAVHSYGSLKQLGP